jgi:hypothetical protein
VNIFLYLLSEVIAASPFSWFFYWVVLNIFRAGQNFSYILLNKEKPKQEFAATLTAGINAGIWGMKFGGPEKYTLAPTMVNIGFWVLIALAHGFVILNRIKENRASKKVYMEPEGLSLEEEYRLESLDKIKRDK